MASGDHQPVSLDKYKILANWSIAPPYFFLLALAVIRHLELFNSISCLNIDLQPVRVWALGSHSSSRRAASPGRTWWRSTAASWYPPPCWAAWPVASPWTGERRWWRCERCPPCSGSRGERGEVKLKKKQQEEKSAVQHHPCSRSRHVTADRAEQHQLVPNTDRPPSHFSFFNDSNQRSCRWVSKLSCLRLTCKRTFWINVGRPSQNRSAESANRQSDEQTDELEPTLHTSYRHQDGAFKYNQARPNYVVVFLLFCVFCPLVSCHAPLQDWIRSEQRSAAEPEYWSQNTTKKRGFRQTLRFRSRTKTDSAEVRPPVFFF